MDSAPQIPAGRPPGSRGAPPPASSVLRESPLKLEAAHASMADAVFVTDHHGRLVEFNEAFARFHRFADKAACLQSWRESWDLIEWSFVTGQPAPAEHGPVARALRGEQVTHAEYALRRRDTGESWIGSYSFAPIRDGTGAIVGAVLTGRDITEQKRAEQALRENAERFRSLVTASAQMVWSTDAEGLVLQALPGWSQYTGQTDEDVRGEGWLKALHPDDVAGAIAAWREALSKRSAYTTEYRMRRHDGVYRIFAVRGVPIFDEAGGVREWIGTCTDITEQRMAQDEMKRTAARLAALNRLGSIMSSHLDLSKVFDEFAREMGVLFEFARTTYIAVHPERDEWEIVQHWSRVSDAVSMGWRAPLRGTAMEWVAREKHPLVENELGVNWTESALARELGVKSRVLVPLVLNDAVIGILSVSSQQPEAFPPEVVQFLQALADQLVLAVHNARLYGEVQRYAAELEQRVAQRTAELEAANRELEAFSYSVSHDLRAPLRAIAGFAAILVEDHAAAMSPTAARYATLVQNAADKMARLIDDLLEFSRFGRQALSTREVDIARMFQEVGAEVQASYPGRNIQLTVGDLPPCRADPSLLRQVITNLLSNAFKYTGPRDPAIIEVSATPSREGAPVIYRVKDNGVGFDMAYASKLFGVFQRLHRSEEFEGTGVGLAIVQRIIHRHGGQISAESAVNQGTTFSFTLAERIVADAAAP